MISRHWTGIAKKNKAEEYVHHLREHTFPQLKDIEGFISASILKRDMQEGVEFLVITNWESIASIKTFAGPDAEIAVVPVTAQNMMIRFDRKARHYEIIES
jgi:heme-degrading monooxygenase HmoA